VVSFGESGAVREEQLIASDQALLQPSYINILSNGQLGRSRERTTSLV
jgi:hypothetical protein